MRLSEIVDAFMACLAGLALWMVLTMAITSGLTLSDTNENTKNVTEIIRRTPAAIIVPALIMALVLEEIVFRLIPLALAVRFGNDRIIVAIALISSATFGYLHGGKEGVDIPSIVIVAGLGLSLSVLFLKCGGIQKKLMKPFLAACTLHALINIVALSKQFL